VRKETREAKDAKLLAEFLAELGMDPGQRLENEYLESAEIVRVTRRSVTIKVLVSGNRLRVGLVERLPRSVFRRRLPSDPKTLGQIGLR
jgi:hypothetical protein